MKPFLIFTTILLVSSRVFGNESDNILHITAHFGATYVITHVTEVVCEKISGVKHKIVCTIAAVALANAVNIGRKVEQGLPNDTGRAVISGGAGSLTAAFIINF